MWNNQKVSLVIPTYREKNSIRDCILRFKYTGLIDEIIVVDNNAESGTFESIIDLNIRIIKEIKQGYGSALKRGLANVTGDLIVLCEPDGTFFPEDLIKLLVYSQECNVVFGSRTVQTFIWKNANMGSFLRWGNWFVAKLLEVLYNTSYMSDVGCTFRLFDSKVGGFILNKKLSDKSSFGLEMQVEVVKSKKFSYVQIPIRYGPRIGESTITGDFGKSISLGLRMIKIIIVKRFSLF
jgi:glycosyltransferase involved in cell wall biosynthesis